MATAQKIDLLVFTEEELLKALKAKQEEKEAQKEGPYLQAKQIIEEAGFTFEDFVKWHKNKYNPIIWESDFYSHQKGKIGKIAEPIKKKIIDMGKEKALTYAKNDDGKKWVENIFNPKK